MALSPDLLEILRCPENRTSLTVADADLVAKLNAAIAKTSLKNKGGEAVAEPIDGALVREDRQVAYPVREDIPVMLVEEGIPLDQLA